MFIKKFPFIERKEKSMHIFIRDEFDLYSNFAGKNPLHPLKVQAL